MAGTLKQLVGPVAMSATMTTNIFNEASALIYSVIRIIHVVNKTAGAATFSLWRGATGANAAGTELYSAESVPANTARDFYCARVMKNTDFLVGGASAGATLTIEVEGEQLVVP